MGPKNQSRASGLRHDSLQDGQRALTEPPTLTDVFSNPADTHGQATLSLTPAQLQQLVAYLMSL